MRQRSYLFVPGNRPERFTKALGSGCDAVIVDLEDAVSADAKDAARASVATWLSGQVSAHVRINAVGTPWFEDDLQMCCEAGVETLVLPKAERSVNISDIVARLRVHGHTPRIVPLIESAQGMWAAMDLARSEGVERLMFGTVDFQHDLGISGDDQELLHFRSHLVLVSRVAGLVAPIDGVTTAIADLQRLRADTLRGKRLGFGAKACIHPTQIGVVNDCYQAGADERAWAQRVIEAAGAAKGDAIAVDGHMVDRPVLARAEAILAGVGRNET